MRNSEFIIFKGSNENIMHTQNKLGSYYMREIPRVGTFIDREYIYFVVKFVPASIIFKTCYLKMDLNICVHVFHII